MPIIRLLLLITGNLRIFSASIVPHRPWARSSSSRQQWMPGGPPHRVRRAREHRSCPAPTLQTMSRSVTTPISWSSLSNRKNGAYIMLTHQFREVSVTGVSGLTSRRPCAITSF